MSIVIVGSLAFDTIETPETRMEKIVGGSCAYSVLAASYFTDPKIVAVVGSDFPSEVIELFQSRGVDTRGLTIEKGKTFHWEGRYGHDPNQRTTIKTELNVFEDFKPELLPDYREADIVFLGNIDPDIQEDIRLQLDSPRLIAMDTINLWINIKRDSLLKVLGDVDMFFANDEEVKMLAGENNLITAGKKLLELGPSYMIIKKGEHGALLLNEDFIFGTLAFPCENVVDPTGAGDSFGGGFLGYLDKVQSFDEKHLRRAAVYGSVMASFTIEKFGIEGLKSLTHEQIEQRYSEFNKLVSF
ncbi:PfkB family carbohydrate kinase [Acidobacteriota bacterium]